MQYGFKAFSACHWVVKVAKNCEIPGLFHYNGDLKTSVSLIIIVAGQATISSSRPAKKRYFKMQR